MKKRQRKRTGKKMNVAEIVAEKILAKLEEGKIPWVSPWFSPGKKVKFITGKSYRGVNLMLLDRQGEFVTFTQLQQKNGKLKKGARAQMVVFFKFLEKKVDGEDTNSFDEEENVELIPMMRYYRVFHIGDTTLESKIDFGEQKWQDDKELDSLIEKFADNSGVILDDAVNNRAFFDPNEDRILLPKRNQFKSDEEYYKVKFHEMIHSTGQPHKLDRQLAGNMKSESYSFEELVAEMGAFMLMSHFGLDSTEVLENSTAYIQSWLKRLKEDKTMVIKACSQAQKAFDYVLDKMGILEEQDFHQVINPEENTNSATA